MTLPRSRLVAALLAVAGGGIALAFWSGGEEDPETEVTRTVLTMTRAAEEKDVSGVMEHVSARFRSAEGWTRDEAKLVVARQVLSGTWVRIFTTDLKVSISTPTTAQVSARFIFGRSEAQKLADLAQESVLSAYQIDGQLEREPDGQWRFVWAQHQPLPPGALF